MSPVLPEATAPVRGLRAAKVGLAALVLAYLAFALPPALERERDLSEVAVRMADAHNFRSVVVQMFRPPYYQPGKSGAGLTYGWAFFSLGFAFSGLLSPLWSPEAPHVVLNVLWVLTVLGTVLTFLFAFSFVRLYYPDRSPAFGVLGAALCWALLSDKAIEIHPDSLAYAMTLLALIGAKRLEATPARRRWFVGVVVAYSMAVLFKSYYFPLAVPLALTLAVSEARRRSLNLLAFVTTAAFWKAVAAAAVVGLAVLLAIYPYFFANLDAYLEHTRHELMGQTSYDLGFWTNVLRLWSTVPVYLPLAGAVLLAGVVRARRARRMGDPSTTPRWELVAACFGVAFLTFMGLVTVPRVYVYEQYLAPGTLLLGLVAPGAWTGMLADWAPARRRWSAPWFRTTRRALFAVFFGVLALRVHVPFQDPDDISLVRILAVLKARVPPEARVCTAPLVYLPHSAHRRGELQAEVGAGPIASECEWLVLADGRHAHQIQRAHASRRFRLVGVFYGDANEPRERPSRFTTNDQRLNYASQTLGEVLARWVTGVRRRAGPSLFLFERKPARPPPRG